MPYYVEKETDILLKSKTEFFWDGCSERDRCMVFAHLHPSIEILIIHKGSFRIEVDGVVDEVGEGDVVLIRSNTIHRIFSLEAGETGYFVYKIKPELLIDLAEGEDVILYLLQLNHRRGKYIWRKEEIEDRAISTVVGLAIADYCSRPHSMKLSLKANAVLLLTELVKSLEDDSFDRGKISVYSLRKIYEAITVINERYGEDLTARDCAAEVNMCYTHFSRCFKSVIGKTFTRYLNEVRINAAEKELYMTDRSVTEIAYKVGFNDASYFVAIYKKIRGKTPHTVRGVYGKNPILKTGGAGGSD